MGKEDFKWSAKWTEDKVRKLRQISLLTNPQSLDGCFKLEDGEEGDTLKDLIVDPSPTPEEIAIRNINKEALIKLIKTALPPKDTHILFLRFGFYGSPKTLEEIGKEYNVTRERIRQIEAKALMRLRRYMKRHGVYERSEWVVE